MARSRVVKPEFWDDEKLATISRDARLTFIGMWSHSDDYAVVKGHPAWLKNKIFPYEEISPIRFSGWLGELEKLRCIIPFQAEGEKFYYIRSFTKHQVINRPSAQRNPEPPENILDDSLNTHGGLTDETETETEVKPKQKRVSINELMQMFEKFWTAYPKKKSKGDAENAFKKINPSENILEAMLSKIEQAKMSEDWIKNDGQYIPYPATWLNRKGWEDDITVGRTMKTIDAELLEWQKATGRSLNV